MSGAALAGRVVLLTGATGGLGGALAGQLAADGAIVIASSRQVRRLERLHAGITAAGGHCQLYPMDLAGASPADLDECVGRILQAHGRLDALVHCAADFPGLTPLAHVDPAVLARTVHVNLTARIWLTVAALPALEASAGVVALVHDAPARTAAPYWGGYGLAQQAQAALATMWQGETGGRVRILSHVPDPMPTALRARAHSHETGPVSRPQDEAARLLRRLREGWSGQPVPVPMETIKE